MDWTLWRCVLDRRIPDTLADVRRWTFPDWLDAQIVLDTLDFLTPDDGPGSPPPGVT